MFRETTDLTFLHEDKIDLGIPLSAHEVHENAQVTLDSYRRRFQRFDFAEVIEVLLSLQHSGEEQFIESLHPESLEQLKPTIEMVLPMKHGAVGGDKNLLEYAERKLYEAEIAAYAMSYEEGLSQVEIQRAKNRIESWRKTAELLKGDDEPCELDERSGCASLVYRFNRYLVELNERLNEGQVQD